MIDFGRSRIVESHLRVSNPTRFRRAGALALLLLTSSATALAAPLASTTAPAASDPLWAGFQNPGEAAHPRVWWHWMNGNVTTAGITADLEWMKRVGIGGMQMFDGSLGTPQFVDDRLVWMTPAWKQAFRHAAKEADRLGLEMTMAGPGSAARAAPQGRALDTEVRE